jgi:hypothetical protein
MIGRLRVSMFPNLFILFMHSVATWFAWYIRYISFCTGGMGDGSLVDDTPVNIISLGLVLCYVVMMQVVRMCSRPTFEVFLGPARPDISARLSPVGRFLPSAPRHA